MTVRGKMLGGVAFLLLTGAVVRGSFDFSISTLPTAWPPAGIHTVFLTEGTPGASTRGLAVQFLVPDNGVGATDETFLVENVFLPVLYAYYPPLFEGPEDILNVYIANDAGGNVGAQIGDKILTPGSGTSWDGSVFLTAPTPVEVTEGGTYWLVLQADFGEDINNETNYFTWYESQTFSGAYADEVGDGDWSFSWKAGSGAVPGFAMNIPEPSAFGLLGLAGAWMACRRRRRS